MSRVPRPVACIFGLFIVALLVAGPWGYWAYRNSLLRNFRVVREGVLYRSGQLGIPGLRHVIQEYGIRTVVTLRDSRKHPDEPPPDSAEEQYCADHFINYYRLPPISWSQGASPSPALASVQKFVEVMRNPANYPVLVHCWAGIHRTGAFCAVYRMEIEHWSNEAAIAEMVQLGYDADLLGDHEDVRTFLETYRPSWQRAPSGRSGQEEAEGK
jgi:tyrosine-protein phosphatase SIW14